MISICGEDCCKECSRKQDCGGCTETDGHPFGGICIAAKHIKQSGFEEFLNLKNHLIQEINLLGLKDLQINDLNLLNGYYVNLEYPLPNGQFVKFLEDNNVYWGNQIEVPNSDRCYGIVADDTYLLICQYGCNGTDPEIILYKKR